VWRHRNSDIKGDIRWVDVVGGVVLLGAPAPVADGTAVIETSAVPVTAARNARTDAAARERDCTDIREVLVGLTADRRDGDADGWVFTLPPAVGERFTGCG
jgi:hypothetical protein